jgi:DNA-binding NarL/FixJ family response regulator
MIRVVLADDHELMRNGVKTLLASTADIEVCGEAAGGKEAVARTLELKPDVIVLDLRMPDMSGLEVVKELRKSNPDIEVLIFSIDDAEEFVREALAAGANGYVLKRDAGVHLVDAVRALANHQQYFSADLGPMFVRSFIRNTGEITVDKHAPTPLSAREIQIMKLLAEGKSNKQIAAELFISVRTVETHRRQIFLKLDIGSVAELVHYAIRNRFTDA